MITVTKHVPKPERVPPPTYSIEGLGADDIIRITGGLQRRAWSGDLVLAERLRRELGAISDDY